MSMGAGTDIDTGGGNTAIDIEKLEVRFKAKDTDTIALDRVSLCIDSGRFVVLIGPSGCGKSTLLRTMGDLLYSSSGSLKLFGSNPQQARQQRRISFVFQDATLLPWRTVRQNIELPLLVGGWTRQARASWAVDDLIELVGLGGRHDAFPHELSGGQRQRVAIARALVTKPDVLLMDEPFGALDEITRDKLNDEMLRIWRETQTTIVFVTHGLAEATFLGQSVVVMGANPGRIIAEVNLDAQKPGNRIDRASPEFFGINSQLRGLLADAYGKK